jgi:protein-L-isoaspartate(D-aspartate) O-methyltransferase
MQLLINQLIQQGHLKTNRIIKAFRKINRSDFVLPEFTNYANVNAPLPIGFDQTISQPLTVAFMLELLQPKPNDKILDVGSGSGWTTALLAEIAGKRGRVFALEIIPELCKFGEENVRKYFSVGTGRSPVPTTKFLCADGSRGYPPEAPYDKILVSAAAQKVPEALKNQLKIHGRLVIPVQNSILLVERLSQKKFREEEYFGFAFVPLVSSL